MPYDLRRMSLRNATLPTLLATMAVALAIPALASATSGPQTGRYKATTSAGTAFEFRVVKATCAPPVRGGNQHQKKGFCFAPVTDPTIDLKCPDGAEYGGESYALFEELLSSSGQLSTPETSSDGTTGVFHITVDRRGHASGYFQIVEQHYAEGAQTPTPCPSGKITFSAKRA
jgi:hypothetical protein